MSEEKEKNLSRRSFVKAGALGLLSLPLLKAGEALAAKCKTEGAVCSKSGKKMVGPDHKFYKKYEYVEDASKAKSNKKFKTGSNCWNCTFYKQSKEKDGVAPCTLFTFNCVSACGWCNKWTKHAARFKKSQKS